MLSETEMVIRLLLAVFFGGLIGFEREKVHKPAGLRTHMLVASGSVIFTILSFEAFPGADPSRMAAAIIAGIGFIGAGTIIKSEHKISGVTTAASLWSVAAISVATGVGYYLLATIAAAISYVILRLGRIEKVIE